MSKRQRYDFEMLDKYCKENDVILLHDYTDIFLTRESFIKGNCSYKNCENEFEKKI